MIKKPLFMGVLDDETNTGSRWCNWRSRHSDVRYFD